MVLLSKNYSIHNFLVSRCFSSVDTIIGCYRNWRVRRFGAFFVPLGSTAKLLGAAVWPLTPSTGPAEEPRCFVVSSPVDDTSPQQGMSSRSKTRMRKGLDIDFFQVFKLKTHSFFKVTWSSIQWGTHNITSQTLTALPRWQAQLPGIVRTGAGWRWREDSMSGKGTNSWYFNN